MTPISELVRPARIDSVVNNLERAVAFETTAGRSNLPYISHMRERFEGLMTQHQVPAELFAIVQKETIAPDGTLQHSLALRLGPKRDGGIAFVGHSDVVAVSEDDRRRWRTDPFQMVTEKGPDNKLLYRGRGTSDMLAGNEAAFSSLEEVVEDVESMQRPLFFGLSWGEESTCMGGDDITAALEEIGARPDVIIVPEPTGDAILTAHKGAQVIDYKIKGPDAFRSAMQLVKGIHGIQDRLMGDPHLQDTTFDPTYAVANAGTVRLDPITNEVSVGVQVRDTPKKAPFESIWGQLEGLRQEILVNPQTRRTIGDQTEAGTLQRIIFTGIGGHSAFPERGVDVGRAMVASIEALDEVPGVSVDVVSAGIGNANNAIPGSGELLLALSGLDSAGAREDFEARLTAISDRMRKEAERAIRNGGKGIVNEIGVSMEPLDTIKPSQPSVVRRVTQPAIDVTMGGRAYPLPPQDPSRVALLHQIIAEATGEQPNTRTVAYGTDAGHLERWIRRLVPHALVVVDGPGDMLQGPHGLDEYVTRRQIEKALAVNDQLVGELMKPNEEYALGK